MTPSIRRSKLVPLLILALALLAVGFALDRSVAEWVQRAVPLDKRRPATRDLIFFLRLFGYFPFTLAVAVALGCFHPRRWTAALALFLSGVVVGALYSSIKWMTGRYRPVIGIAPFSFHPFPRGLLGLFHPEKALCFPSGDTTLAFATASCLAMLLPRWRVLFWLLAAITGAERVLENAHYVSDVIAGATLGTAVGYFTTRAIVGSAVASDLTAAGNHLSVHQNVPLQP